MSERWKIRKIRGNAWRLGLRILSVWNHTFGTFRPVSHLGTPVITGKASVHGIVMGYYGLHRDVGWDSHPTDMLHTYLSETRGVPSVEW